MAVVKLPPCAPQDSPSRLGSSTQDMGDAAAAAGAEESGNQTIAWLCCEAAALAACRVVSAQGLSHLGVAHEQGQAAHLTLAAPCCC
jgi:hypothetical protein